jgi:G:T-mismatch repair DNA endonuclease (very short patch repair protein)
MDFDTAYVLLSRKIGSDRWTTRVERFSTRDRRRRAVDNKREHGHAVTVAWLRDVSPNLRAGVEYARVKGERGGGPDTGGSTITLELRYGF